VAAQVAKETDWEKLRELAAEFIRVLDKREQSDTQELLCLSRFVVASFSPYIRAMLSPGDRATIKAEIEKLQKAQRECTDSRIQTQIDAWIEEQKQAIIDGKDAST
jgi:hypothetical protein